MNIFDIVINVGLNDKEIIKKQIVYTKKNIIGYRNIYLIVYFENFTLDDCIIVNDNIFPFNINDIEKYLGNNKNNGCVLRQLLKLYAGNVIPNILDKYLVIDADTFFLKETIFINNNICLYNPGKEYHYEYFDHIKKLHPTLYKVNKDLSGISHHMIFETKYIKSLFKLIENYHKKEFYKVFLENIIIGERFFCSEYELYFNYMLIYHNDNINIRNLKWDNTEYNNLEYYKNLDYDYISSHHYLVRKKKYLIFKKSGRLGNALFRYFASILFCIKYDLEFILEDDYNDLNDNYIFYKGVDQVNNDIKYLNNKTIDELKCITIDELKCICDKNINYYGFNTLGFIKSYININELKSNNYINQKNDHGIYVKNNIIINDNNFFEYLNYNYLSNYNIIMDGYFQYDKIYLENKDKILKYVKEHKNEHYIAEGFYNQQNPYKKFLMKDLVNDIILHNSIKYDLVINIRLGDFEGLDIYIEYIYLEKFFNTIHFNKDWNNAIVIDRIKNKKDNDYLNKCLEWFHKNGININVESNDVLTDFNIMKQCKVLVCSNSTLSWSSGYLSNKIEKCYMPFNLNKKNDSKYLETFKKPIENTEFYYYSNEGVNNTVLNKVPYKIKNIEKSNCYIGGCVFNCNKYLENIFKNILKVRQIFNEIKVIVAYDNSYDNSLETLNQLNELYNKSFSTEIIINTEKMSDYKTENITNARNSILNYIRNDNDSSKYDYFIMMDFDDVCEKDLNTNILEKYLDKKYINEWDSLSFNRKDYYDIWALSIKPFFTSCWHWSIKQIDSSFVVDIMRKYIEEKLSEINTEQLLECESAFNGFAIYRKDKFINSNYNSNVFKSHSILTHNMIIENINALNKLTGKDNVFFGKLLEDCEHRHFHLNAIKNNNVKIRISPLDLFSEEIIEESECKYVSSRGILKSCDVKSTTPISSINQLINYDFSKLKDGCTLYVCNYAIPYFTKFIDQIPCKFILVSGDSDCSPPNGLFMNNYDFINFIENEKLIFWFAQNCSLSHPKMSIIPIGLDYHTMAEKDSDWGKKINPKEQEKILENINSESEPFYKREIKCYANFHFSMNTKYGDDRKDAFNNINRELVFYEENKVERTESWKTQSKYAFVISPHGNGLDCHRTWEALCLGCIPIIKKSDISEIFYDLPVLVVNKWEDINYYLLVNTINDIHNKNKLNYFNYDKLTLNYWINYIKSAYINNIIYK